MHHALLKNSLDSTMDDLVLEVLVRKTNDTNNKSEGALHFWMFRYAMQASRTMLCDICCILNSIQITGSRGQFCNHAPDVLQAQKANKPEHVHCKKSCPEMPPHDECLCKFTSLRDRSHCVWMGCGSKQVGLVTRCINEYQGQLGSRSDKPFLYQDRFRCPLALCARPTVGACGAAAAV